MRRVVAVHYLALLAAVATLAVVATGNSSGQPGYGKYLAACRAHHVEGACHLSLQLQFEAGR